MGLTAVPCRSRRSFGHGLGLGLPRVIVVKPCVDRPESKPAETSRFEVIVFMSAPPYVRQHLLVK